MKIMVGEKEEGEHILDRTMSAMSLRQERTCLRNQEEASMATVRKSRGERCQMQRAEAGPGKPCKRAWSLF